MRDVVRLRWKVEAAIDNAEPGAYASVCDQPDARSEIRNGTVYVTPGICGANLWAKPGERIVTCEVCGASYPVAELREYLLKSARDRLVTQAEAVDLLRAFGINITLQKLKDWVSRDRRDFAEIITRKPRYPPILMVSATVLDGRGEPLMEPDIDPDTKEPRLNRFDQPIMRSVGRPLFRLGDVMDRLVALQTIEAERSKQKVSA